MSLHARSVAVAAGALGDEVEAVAAVIASRGTIVVAEAEAVLAELRARSAAPLREG
jgi:hydroxymethylglutaryl-CoA reductase